jgi:transcriptional regulator with XRE-family HTH domain
VNQTNQLLDALKKCLRAKGLTYRDVAEALDMSEASIKRIFSQKTFTLARLEEVCRFLDMSIYDLARLTEMYADRGSSVLSVPQEEALAEDSSLLTYFYLLLLGQTTERIAEEYGVDKLQETRLLTRLDRLKLIDLFPKNRFRLLTSRRILWRPDGPIRRKYEQQVKAQFLAHRFKGEDDWLSLESTELSAASIKVLTRKLERLSQDFDELAELDMTVPRRKKQSFGLMLALRPWTYWDILEPSTQSLTPPGQRPDER